VLADAGAANGGGVPTLGAVEHHDVADAATRQGVGRQQVQRQRHGGGLPVSAALNASRSLPKIDPSPGLASLALGPLLAAQLGELAQQRLLLGVDPGRGLHHRRAR
jgi:hypothetical protein